MPSEYILSFLYPFPIVAVTNLTFRVIMYYDKIISASNPTVINTALYLIAIRKSCLPNEHTY